MRIQGKAVVAGLAYGPAIWMREFHLPKIPRAVVPGELRSLEKQKFQAAVSEVVKKLREKDKSGTTQDSAQNNSTTILEVEIALATDPTFAKEVICRIKRGESATNAVIDVIDEFAHKFRAANDLVAERSIDLYDLRNRIVAKLEGMADIGLPEPSEPSVLLATDLSPTDAVSLSAEKFCAVVTELGGPTSHTSVLARQAGIPCIVAARGLSAIKEGDVVFVDAHHGVISTQVSPLEANERLRQEELRREKILGWLPPGRTKDSHSVPLLANIANVGEAKKAHDYHAQGVGLLRTEVNFLSAATEPTISEQITWYDQIFSHFSAEKVVVRTLDAGSDKAIPFLSFHREENPALGMRGLRTSLLEPNHLLRQLEAISAAAKMNPDTEVWAMAPMVSTISEARNFTHLCHEHDLKGGIMVEVPAVAVLAEEFAQVVDFMSIGTNDLAQYVMAADRQSPDLVAYNDLWQPAVLRLIAQVAKAGEKSGVPVGVCGEAATDPVLACVLVGLGASSLSMAAPQISTVGSTLFSYTLDECRLAAAAACRALDPQAAREAARRILASKHPLH